MKKIKSLLMAVGLMVATVLSGVAESAMAVTVRLSVSPMASQIILIPGEVYRGSIDVTNPYNSEEDLNYIVEVGSYVVSSGKDSKDSYGDVDVSTVTAANEMMNWISLENEKGTLAPNETAAVVYNITVPENAPAGAQYATLLVREDGDTGVSDGVVINEVAQLGSVIYANVAGEIDEEGRILENNVPTFLLDNQLEVTSIVENNGNVYTDAEYSFQVLASGSNKEICATEDEATTSVVLPGTKRYHQETCELPGIGIYNVKQTVKIFGEISTVESMVIYCPIWLMLIIAFVVVAVIIWVMMMVKKRK